LLLSTIHCVNQQLTAELTYGGDNMVVQKQVHAQKMFMTEIQVTMK